MSQRERNPLWRCGATSFAHSSVRQCWISKRSQPSIPTQDHGLSCRCRCCSSRARTAHHPLRDSIALLKSVLPAAAVCELPGQDHNAYLMGPHLLSGALGDFFQG